MKIDTGDLVNIIDTLKSNLVETFPNGVDVDKEDFYWQIRECDLYDPAKEPNVNELGQLSDDWNELLRLKNSDNFPISYDLSRLAVILQIVRKKSIGIW